MKIFSILCFVIFLAEARAQSPKEGIVYYDQVQKFKAMMNINGEMTTEEKQKTFPVTLTFNLTESLFQRAEEDEESDNGGMKMKFHRPHRDVYNNFKTLQQKDATEMMGKNYLIEDSLIQKDWKIGAETKVILGYPCQKAVYNDTAKKQNTVAWFTTNIPCPSGPELNVMLPGMILELDENEGKNHFLATKVELKKINAKDLEAPKEGKKIDRAAFMAMVDEQRKKMEKMMRH